MDLRERDLDAAAADAAARALVDVTLTAKVWPAIDNPGPPPGWRETHAEPEPRKTVWKLTDDGW